MTLAKGFAKKTRELERLSKRDLEQEGITFGEILSTYFPLTAENPIPQLTLHMVWSDVHDFEEEVWPHATQNDDDKPSKSSSSEPEEAYSRRPSPSTPRHSSSPVRRRSSPPIPRRSSSPVRRRSSPPVPRRCSSAVPRRSSSPVPRRSSGPLISQHSPLPGTVARPLSPELPVCRRPSSELSTPPVSPRRTRKVSCPRHCDFC
jgi:hypothetical protein